MTMMCEGAMGSILPTITLHKFGTKRGQQIYSFMYSNFGAQALVGSLIVGFLEYKIGYFGFFVICFIFTLLSAYIVLIYDDKTMFNFDTLISTPK